MKRPFILWLVVAFAALAAFSNGIEALAALLVFGTRPYSEVLGYIVVSAIVCGVSIYVLIALLKRMFRSRIPVSIYLWFMLAIYPVCNVLRMFGFYLPRPEFTPQQLAGAALAELLRYIVPLVLIVWVGFSRGLKTYLQPQSSDG